VKALWTSGAAVDATGGRAPVGWHAGGVSIDSRSLSPGDLFVALEGPNFDGHDFAAEALRLGAAAVMVRPGSRTVPPEAPVLEVADTLRGLQALGRAARARAGAVIGITGSVGKTGTRAMLEAALRPSGATSASQRSFNNHWGVPLTLARIPCGARFAVLEMGMNRAGELRRLSALARPDVMVVTAVAEAHLAAFGTLEAIAAAKAEAFAHLCAGGTAILPAECPGQEILAQAARAAGAGRIWTFGDAAHADARLLQAHSRAGATGVRARVLGHDCAWRLGAAGRQWAANSLAVQLALRAVKADLGRAACALAGWRPPAGRGAAERIELASSEAGECLVLLDDAYNANPASMRAAVDRLAEEAVGPAARGVKRRIAFLGDMLELGPESGRLHRELASVASLRQLDAVHLCGEHMRGLHEALPMSLRGRWMPNAERMAALAPQLVAAGDMVLVKGSNAVGMKRVADRLRSLQG